MRKQLEIFRQALHDQQRLRYPSGSLSHLFVGGAALSRSWP